MGINQGSHRAAALDGKAVSSLSNLYTQSLQAFSDGLETITFFNTKVAHVTYDRGTFSKSRCYCQSGYHVGHVPHIHFNSSQSPALYSNSTVMPLNPASHLGEKFQQSQVSLIAVMNDIKCRNFPPGDGCGRPEIGS